MLDTKECHQRVIAMLTAARKRIGIRQQELAERMQIPQSYVSRMEQGHRQIRLCEFFLLATALEFDVVKAVRQLTTPSSDCPPRRPRRAKRNSPARRRQTTKAAA